MNTQEDIIKAAMSVARDAAEGGLDPAALDAAVADECRALFGLVVGDGDPLWPLHQDITRQSIALGALSADELTEWTAVARRREQTGQAVEPAETRDDIDLPSTTGRRGFVSERAAQPQF